ncbi:hypothetical protein EZV62_009302 [Acer yangbiense]|uniref:Uncharacterized protein n=1 Tax=Acer yangbiense TaxID=1000413 RepID=A0A5C7IFA9_9ROSI|nr:hypothetical protein EZV62_009302 [Acer yangbiense]
MTELLIENCSNLVSFPEVCFLSNLSKLEIRNCNALTSLPKGIVCNSLTGQLPSYLKRLEIVSCEKLEYLWDDNEESCTSVVDEENNNNTTRSLLEYLHVRECPSLKFLSSSGLLPETLQHLYVECCYSLTFIVRGKLPSSLKKLEIKGCEKLEYLWDDKEESCTSVVDEENNYNTSTSHLEYLRVRNCLSLKCLSSSGHLPKELRTLSLDSLPELESIAKTFLNSRSLEEITVKFCKNLKSIPKGLHNLIHLRKIKIYNCESIDGLGEEGSPNLSILKIFNCEKLKALPNWFHSLNSLKSLTLNGCPSMTTFPEEGFPTNLTSLTMSGLNVTMYKAVLEWGLHNLTSLTSLEIEGDEEAESFPQQELEMTFPPSLTHLIISSFPNLKSFSKLGLPSSLSELRICFCRKLRSFPEQGLPSSLSKLNISFCGELRSFPEQGLPSSLSNLEISFCEELRSFPKQGLPSSLLELEYIYESFLLLPSASSTFLIHWDMLECCEESFSHVMSVSLSCGVDILGPLVWSMDLFKNSSLSFAAADESDDFYKNQQYKNRHLSMLHFTRKVLPCPVVYFPSCNSFCMHEESKDKEIMNPPLKAFIAVFFLYANTQQLPGFGDRTTIFQSQHFKCQVYVYVLS